MNPIIMRFRHIAVSLSCLCLAQLLNAQLTHTVTFDRNLLSIDTTVVDRVSYLKIKYLDLWGEGNIGSPELPVHYLRFSVPYNAVDFTVTITEQNTVTEHYTLPVYPVQPVRLTPPISRLFFQIVLYTTVADIAQYLRYRLSMKVFSMAITTSSP